MVPPLKDINRARTGDKTYFMTVCRIWPIYVFRLRFYFFPLLAACSSENLLKATAHLFRNLAWKADKMSKKTLSESNVVKVLIKAAMTTSRIFGAVPADTKEEPTLKVLTGLAMDFF